MARPTLFLVTVMLTYIVRYMFYKTSIGIQVKRKLFNYIVLLYASGLGQRLHNFSASSKADPINLIGQF